MAEVSDILRERCMLHRRGDKTALPAAHTNAMLSIETYLNRVGHITPMQSNYVQDVLGIAKKSSGGKDGGSKAITAGGASKGPIAYKKGGHYELHFTYDLQRITAVKAIQGRKWDADKKFWTVPGGVLNEETLRSIGFEIEDRTPVVRTTEVKQITKIEGLKGTPFPYQMEGISFIDSRNGRALLADEAGCIDGEMKVTVNRAGCARTMTLEKFYSKFHNPGVRQRSDIQSRIRSLCDGTIRLNIVKDVLDKGWRETIKLTTKAGKTLICTPDHELFDGHVWKAAELFTIGSTLTTNGIPVCKICGGTEKVTTYPYSKFQGVCRSCVYKKCRVNHTFKGGKSLDKDGYVLVSGHHDHPRRHGSSVREHILVMEAHIGRYVTKKEVVHHINGDKQDNRLENLKLMSFEEHCAQHGKETKFIHMNSGLSDAMAFLPKADTVIRVESMGCRHVYDIVMDDPHRNFVTNGVIVHNCGKSLQSISWVWMRREISIPALVVCPSCLKVNWQREVYKWTGFTKTQILTGLKPTRIHPDVEVAIINYDILDRKDGSGWIEDLKSFGFKTVIADECHAVSNRKAISAKAMRSLSLKVDHFIAMTGTPILNRPAELYMPLKMVRKDLFADFMSYALKFANAKQGFWGWDFSGASNVDELNQLLTSTVMLRRKKEDVLKDLPPKRIATQAIELGESGMKIYGKAMESFRSGNAKNTADALMELAKLRKATMLGKMAGCLEWIEDFLESGEKLVVFAWHKEALNMLQDALKKYNPVRIDGEVPSDKRMPLVDKFQNDKDCKVFLGQIKAAGVGLTLTAASNVAFVEFHWSPAIMDQASSRCHRIGQTESVTSWYLLGVDTIDEYMAEVLDRKLKIIDALVDGQEVIDDNLVMEVYKKLKEAV